MQPNTLLDRELEQVLRTGPLSVALHLAIESRGLTLEQVQTALLARGIGLSLSTLSYWRRGRSRPERRESIRAIEEIERLLELPTGGLTSLIDTRRPRLTRGAPSIPNDRLWTDSAGLDRAYAQLSVTPQDHLMRVSVHERLRVGADRRPVTYSARLVLLALADKVSRCRVVYWNEVQGPAWPTVTRTEQCRPGRLRGDSGFFVAELVLDRVLDRGEYTIIEYEFELGGTVGVIDDWTRRMMVSTREYTVVVRFDPAALPARCVRHESRTVNGPTADGEDVWLGSSHSAQLVVVDVPPGIHGLRWDWD